MLAFQLLTPSLRLTLILDVLQGRDSRRIAWNRTLRPPQSTTFTRVQCNLSAMRPEQKIYHFNVHWNPFIHFPHWTEIDFLVDRVWINWIIYPDWFLSIFSKSDFLLLLNLKILPCKLVFLSQFIVQNQGLKFLRKCFNCRKEVKNQPL